MINRKIASLVIMLLMFTSNLAFAEGEKLKQKLSKGVVTISADVKGCEKDAKQYCPGLNPNSQKGVMCMLAYEEKLSANCKLGIAEAAMAIKMGMAAINYSIRACEADADKHCLDVQPGNGKIVSCLRKNEDKISKDCITALKKTKMWDMGAK